MYKYLFLCCSLVLVGCSSSNGSDRMTAVKRYIAQQQATQAPNQLSPLPQVEQYSIDGIDIHELRNPFMTLAQLRMVRADQIVNTATQNDAFVPDFTRERSEAEKMPLSSMRYTGMIQQGGGFWAIVRSGANGETYRVRVGDFLGEDYGKVIEINDKEMIIDERILSASGTWMPRETILRIQE